MTDTDAERPKVGRPTKLDRELLERIVQAAEEGNTKWKTAVLVGIHRTTLNDWLKAGEEDDADPLFAELYDRFTAARVKTIRSLENAAFRKAIGGYDVVTVLPNGKEVITQAEPDGNLALKLLERMVPDEWRQQVAVTGADGGPVQITGEVAVIEGIRKGIAASRERRAAEAARAEAAAGAYGGQAADDYGTPARGSDR